MSQASQGSSRVLMIRFSSLGDVILSTAAVSAGSARGVRICWLTGQEYGGLLSRDPRVEEVWGLDRKTGVRGLWRVARKIVEAGFDEVVDLHGSLRTRLLRIFLALLAPPLAWKWRRVPKQKLRRWGFCLAKQHWPVAWRPEPWVVRYAKAGGDTTGNARPNLRHLLPGQPPVERSYWAAMPDSKWPGKNWPVERYVELFKRLGEPVVVLGSEKDEASARLVKALSSAGVPVRGALGTLSFEKLAAELGGAKALFSGDTGLAHLAEAIGTSVRVLYGPTDPGMGFGPWRAQSIALMPEHVSCSPCGKDGRVCYRLTQRRACMKDFTSESALEQMDRGRQEWRVGAYAVIES